MTVEAQKLDPRVRRTRQMLFQAFQSLLAEKTFDVITVLDISVRSTLNRATFYDHFPDKFALLESMMSERFGALIAARMAQGDGTCETALRLLILGGCDFLAEVSSGCQKNQRQFEPVVESQVKEVMREAFDEAGGTKRTKPGPIDPTALRGWPRRRGRGRSPDHPLASLDGLGKKPKLSPLLVFERWLH